MKIYEFDINKSPTGSYEIEATKLHTALYRLGLKIERTGANIQELQIHLRDVWELRQR